MRPSGKMKCARTVVIRSNSSTMMTLSKPPRPSFYSGIGSPSSSLGRWTAKRPQTPWRPVPILAIALPTKSRSGIWCEGQPRGREKIRAERTGKTLNASLLLEGGRWRSWTFSARNYFFLACDLNETPRRIAAFFMDSGDRPVSLTTSSKDFEARPSSINRRSSLNDQCRFLTITDSLGSDKVAKRSRDDIAGVGPDLGELVRRSDRYLISRRVRNKCHPLSLMSAFAVNSGTADGPQFQRAEKATRRDK